MHKTKVLYIHQDGLVTGSAISLKYFLEVIDSEKYIPIVLLADEGPARRLYEDLGIEVLVYKFKTLWTSPGPNWYSPLNLRQLRAFLKNKGLLNLIKKINPDIIHINDKAAFNAGISLKKSGIPIIQHSRSTYKDANAKINTYISSCLIKRNSDAIISISEDEADLLENSKNFHIINNTVSPKRVELALTNRDKVRSEFDLEPTTTVISFIGAVSASKGIFSFLELACQLVNKYKGISLKFLVLGKVSTRGNTVLENSKSISQPTSEYIEEFIESNKIASKIKVLGFRKDALSIMAASDILIVPNKISVMGRQPIEAQALGVPVVVAQGHSGKSKIVVDGEGGFVIDSPVKIEELVSKVETLINNPELRKKMGEKGRAYAKERFNPETNMRKIEAIYQELLSAKNA